MPTSQSVRLRCPISKVYNTRDHLLMQIAGTLIEFCDHGNDTRLAAMIPEREPLLPIEALVFLPQKV
jgi:hypothetical protein